MRKLFCRERLERGHAMVMFVMVTILLVGCSMVALDLSQAEAVKAEQQSIIQLVCDQKMSPASTTRIKNSDDPARELATQIVTELRKDGVQGEIKVYYHEASMADINAANPGSALMNRVYVYGVEVTSMYTSMFGRTSGVMNSKGLAMDAEGPIQFSIASFFAKAANPYSELVTWRPAVLNSTIAEINEVYICPADGSIDDMTSETLDMAHMPSEMQRQLNGAFNELKVQATQGTEDDA